MANGPVHWEKASKGQGRASMPGGRLQALAEASCGARPATYCAEHRQC